MFIIEFLLGLKSNQGDITDAVIHSDTGKNEKVCIYLPRGFEHYSNIVGKKCLKLKIPISW